MIRHDRPAQALAIALSTLAGYVDAIGFITVGGFFVSFMSGNTTRLGVALAHGNGAAAALAAGLIGTFLLGVMAGSATGHFAGVRRRMMVLGLSAVVLGAAALSVGAMPQATGFLLAFAMGTENAVFERDGEVQIGVTYMTGTLVKFAQRLVGTLLGGERFAWAPYLLLWLGLAIGAVTGAMALPLLGSGAIWIAAGATAVLAAVAGRTAT